MEELDLERNFLFKAGLIVGSGGLIFGYDIGVISGTLGALTNHFDLNGYEQGLVVSILNAGSIVGCIFGGPLCDILGRWKTIQIQNAIFILGALLTGLADDLGTLCVGRFLVGVASAISGLADVPYLVEISPAQYRGFLSGQYEILVAVGVLLSFCLDLAFSTFHNGWRVAFIFPAIFALAQSLAMILLPESPKWLLSKGLLAKARGAMREIYGESRLQNWIDAGNVIEQGQLNERFAQEAGSLRSAVNEDEQHLTTSSHSSGNSSSSMAYNAAAGILQDCPPDVLNYIRISQPSHQSPLSMHAIGLRKDDSCTELTNYVAAHTPAVSKPSMFGFSDEERSIFKVFRYPISMIVIIQLLSQSATVIRNYAPYIFEQGGASTQMSLILNIALGVVKLFFTTLAVFYIEHQGRRNFLLFGIAIVCMGLAFLTISSAASPGGNLKSAALFIVGCSLIYTGFGFGYGPIPWIISAEMVPTAIRGRIMSVSLIASNLSQLIFGLIFVPMNESITSTGSFGVFLLINFINGVYIYLFLTETRNIIPEVILDDLERRYAMILGHGFSGSERTKRRHQTSMGAEDGMRSAELSGRHGSLVANPMLLND
jgi:MFS family permease